MNTSQAIESDTELIDLAENVLSESGYVVSRVSIGSIPGLLAEDQDNVVALTAAFSVEDLIAVEPPVSNMLGGRLQELPIDAKRWDGYVVLLTRGSPATDPEEEALFGLTYNLRDVRRIVRVRVEAKHAALRRRLRPVLPLTEVDTQEIFDDPVDALQQRLVADGLDLSVALQAVRDFKIYSASQSASALPAEDAADDTATGVSDE